MRSNRSPFILILAWTLGLGMPLSVAAAMYKWVDAEGHTQYSQSLPPGQKGEQVDAPSKVDTESAVKTLKDKETGFQKRQDNATKEADKAAKDAKKAADQKKACEDARNRLSHLQNDQRIFEGNGDQRKRLSDEERLARMKKTQEAIDKQCR